MSDIEIRRVSNETEKIKFIKFPWKIYKGDDNWVPPLIFDVRNNLNTNKNPFFRHAKAEFWLAYKDGKPAGRISGIINHNHNKQYNDKTGFFGFFESIDDKDVSNRLFDTVGEFLRNEGMDTMRGPINLSTNDEVGLLIDGFDTPPVIMMTYNPKYYIDLIEHYGFEKAKDVYAYKTDKSITDNKPVMDKLKRISDIVQKKENIKIRKIDIEDFENELLRVKEIYNNAWIENWGFVPMTDEEFTHIAKIFKQIIDKDLVYFAEVNGKPVGFSLALPDWNIVFKKLNGRLFPFGIIKFLLNKRKIDRIRIITMGIMKEYHRKGIEAVFIKDTILIGIEKRYNKADISWILEDNIPMIQTAEKLDLIRYKTYRIYDKKVG